MSPIPVFTRIDTLILRVRDLQRACDWYATALGLTAAYHDPEEGLAVLPIGDSGSLTLWQLKAGEVPPTPAAAGTYPIFAATDAAAAHTMLRSRGVEAGELTEGAGVRFFTFRDPDGNRLEACAVHSTAAVEADA